MYIHTHMYVCMYVCICIYIYIHTYMCIYIYIHICMYVYIYIYTCMYMCCMYVFVSLAPFRSGHHPVCTDPSPSAAYRASLSVCEVARQSKKYVFVYMYIHICMYIHVYIYIYIYICIHICLYYSITKHEETQLPVTLFAGMGPRAERRLPHARTCNNSY